ncbi:hypothetical protein DTO207G8_8045 [Paecilomyces variotii]|nr:hypothetical protein DTO207G8_8045 [Paecilomyces variotii]KAJ9408465.1 hypothetical protein DTO045G8_3758 [Paecilomyces variotii]
MLQRPDDWVYLRGNIVVSLLTANPPPQLPATQKRLLFGMERGFLSVPPSTKSESSVTTLFRISPSGTFLQHLLNSKEQSETKAALEKSQIHSVRPCQA